MADDPVAELEARMSPQLDTDITGRLFILASLDSPAIRRTCTDAIEIITRLRIELSAARKATHER